MNKNYKLHEKLAYMFDKSMARGSIALIGWLSLISLIVILISALVISFFKIFPENGEQIIFIEAVWGSLMRTMDAGTMGGDIGWGYRIVSLVVTIAGIFVFSALIGIIGTSIDSKLEELRKGRSFVIEYEHTIILNWSTAIFDIISELITANQSRKNPSIVILADKDKVEMEDEIRAKIQDFGNTRIICRSGDSTDLFDIEIVNPYSCRSVVILSPEINNPDSNVLKSILAIVHNPKRRKDKFQIAAEIRSNENVEIAKNIGGDEVQIILADDFMSRIIVQSCRQTGLSAVYSELIGFDGCEIYNTKQNETIHKSFAQIVTSYRNATPIGVHINGEKIILNPDKNYILQPNDEIIIIAEDDSTIKWSGEGSYSLDSIVSKKKKEHVEDKTLIIGWNHRANIIIKELDSFSPIGSKLLIAAPQEISNIQETQNIQIRTKIIDVTNIKDLREIDLTTFDHILVLGDCDNLSPQQADTKTLITLLNIKKLADEHNKYIPVVSEMIDVKNRELAEITKIDDFVVSNKIVSLMLAQASENKHMATIFEDLLREEGAEIYIRSISDYISIDEPVNFYTISKAALLYDQVAIGYRIEKPNRNLVLNPDKDKKIQFSSTDKLIVLSNS